MMAQELNQTTHPLQMLRFHDLLKLQIIGNRVTLARWIRTGFFPAPIRLGPNTVAWRESDVREWLDRRAKEKSE